MANRYCLNDSSRFVSVEGSGPTVRVTIFEEGDDKKIASFTLQRWALFVLMVDEIDSVVSKLSTAATDESYQRHIGGKLYVSITAGFKCVNLREFYWNRGKSAPSPSKRGIALRLPEWRCLSELITHINLQFPELAAAEVCWASPDHDIQEMAKHCPECQPFCREEEELLHSIIE